MKCFLAKKGYLFTDLVDVVNIFNADFLKIPSFQLDQRPSTTYMEKLQQDITPNMRGILIDWLVEVSQPAIVCLYLAVMQ